MTDPVSSSPVPIAQATPAAIARAAQGLREGKLVAFPTETVFGLGANALSAQAVSDLYALKGRPSDKPFAIMVSGMTQAEKLAVLDGRARDLIQAFWPGPLSLVLPQRANNGITDAVYAGFSNISLRMPSHPVALALLKQADVPVAAPSANPSGQPSAVRAIDVARAFSADQLTMVLADTTPLIGIESTVLDLSGDVPLVLRSGAITQEDIETVIGPVTRHVGASTGLRLKTKLRLNAVDVKKDEAFLAFGKTTYIGVEGVGFVRDMPDAHWRNLSAEGDLQQAAGNLYRMVQELDALGMDAIAVQPVPDVGLGVTINERLRMATVAA